MQLLARHRRKRNLNTEIDESFGPGFMSPVDAGRSVLFSSLSLNIDLLGFIFLLSERGVKTREIAVKVADFHSSENCKILKVRGDLQ